MQRGMGLPIELKFEEFKEDLQGVRGSWAMSGVLIERDACRYG